jgi:hypothetical protein
MRKDVLVSIFALITLVICVACAADLTSRAWAVALAVGDSGGGKASRVVLTVKDDKDHKCTLCQVCIKNPDGPNKGTVSCFANWWSKSGCKAKLAFAKSEGAAKGFKISGHCQCERKACTCEGTSC